MDIDEALAASDSNVVPEWLQTQSVQHMKALAAEVRRLRGALAVIEDDVRVAAGKLLVEMPRPGTPMARVMMANTLMRRERDAANDELRQLRGTLGRVGELLAVWPETIKGLREDHAPITRGYELALEELTEALEEETP